MSNCTFLGSLIKDAAGNVVIQRPVFPPRPPSRVVKADLPDSIWRAVRKGRASVFHVVGDSMEPFLLQSDLLVVSATRKPQDGDAVVVNLTPASKNGASVWRYHEENDIAFVTKDNPAHRARVPVAPEQILGVVIRVLPRQWRDEFENYEFIQTILSLETTPARKKNDPSKLGFYAETRVAEFNAVVSIPPTEMLDGRLPWGPFRGVAASNHPSAGILAGDTLTIDPRAESRVGVIVIDRDEKGHTIIGELQREALGTPHPGCFYVDLPGRRVRVSRKDGFPLYRTLGVVRQIARVMTPEEGVWSIEWKDNAR